MKGSKVAVRYARSLFALAANDAEQERIKMDVDLVLQICSERSFRAMLGSPVIKEDKKVSIFRELFDGAVSTQTMQFLNMLAGNKREADLPEICNSYLELYLSKKGKVKAFVTTASKLDENSRNKITGLVKELTHADVIMEEQIDESLLGGFRLRYADVQIDTSVSAKLRNIKKELIQKVY